MAVYNLKSKNLVIFDLDGTLIKGQTQKYLLNYLFKKKWIGFFRLLLIYAWFFGYKFNLFKDIKRPFNWAFKVIKNKNFEEVNKLMFLFCDEVLSRKLNLKIVSILKEHQDKQDEIILLSTAIKPLAEAIGNKLGINKIIATKLEIENKKYSGKILGNIVYGKIKLEIIRKLFSPEKLKNSYAYADHYSDIELLSVVDYPFVVCPSKKTLKKIRENKKLSSSIKIIV